MQIKKSRLVQIIKEEISRIEEVEVARRGGEKERQLFKQYLAAVESGNEQEKNTIANELVKIIIRKVGKNLNFKKFRNPEDYIGDALLYFAEDPTRIDPSKSLPSTFLANQAGQRAVDAWRRNKKGYDSVTKSGDIRTVSDLAQEFGDGSALGSDIAGGSRFASPETMAIARDSYEKLQKEDPTAATAFMLSYMGHTGSEIAELLGTSQPSISRAVNKAKEILSTMEESKSLDEISMNPGGYGSGVRGRTSDAARMTGDEERDRQEAELNKLPKKHDDGKLTHNMKDLKSLVKEVISEML
jgi:DNA-directed RNA polymerase specialized sigma24 family protein